MTLFCATEKVEECWSWPLVSNRDCEPEILVLFFRDGDCKPSPAVDVGMKFRWENQKMRKTTNRSREKHAWKIADEITLAK